MDIRELFEKQVSGVLIDQVSKQFGINDNSQASTAVDTAFSTLINAISKNASTDQGAQSLNNALENDHDGSILNDLAGFLSGSNQPSNTSMLNGSGILNHVLGSNQSNVIEMVSKMANIDPAKANQLLGMVAPVVMGMLGQEKQQNNLNPANINDYLTTQTAKQTAKTPTNTDFITKFLDADGDGSIMDEITDIGLKSLGNFFKK